MSTLFCVPEFREPFGFGHIARQCTLVKILDKNRREAYLTLPDNFFNDSGFLRWLTDRIDANLLLPYSDANALRCSSNVCTKVIIDSYDFKYMASNFGCELKKDSITIIDDLAYERIYPSSCNVIIPNICSQHQGVLARSISKGALRCIYGSQYVLVDPEFMSTSETRLGLRLIRENRLNSSIEGKVALTLLVGFGGSSLMPDAQCKNDFIELLEQMRRICRGVKVHCLGRSAASFCDMAGISAHKYGWLGLGDLRKAYLEADVYFGSIGYSMWERASLFLPSFVTPIAENQIPYTIAGEELGIHCSISQADKGAWFSKSLDMLESAFNLEISGAGYSSLF